MAKKKKTEDGADGAKGSKLPLIIGAVALIAGVVLGGKFMGGGGASAASTTTTTEAPGTVTSLDTITLNLADGRFLKLGIGFEVAADSEYPAHGGAAHGPDLSETPTKGFAKELDAVIDIVSTHTYEDLLVPGGKDKVKAEILTEVKELSHDAIEAVLFHEFVMQ